MDDRDLLCLETGNQTEVTAILKRFSEKHNKTFTFNELNENDKRRRLWDILQRKLDNAEDSACHIHALSCIRILSREKIQLDDLISEQWLETLLSLAGLLSQEEAMTRINQPLTDYEVVLEAQKCLCNIVFNSKVALAMSCKNHTIEGVVMRMRTYRDPDIPSDIKYFDMRLLFIITALCSEVRPRLNEELHGLTYLMETLDLILKEASGEEHHYERGAACSDIHVILSDEHIGLACEILKVLFNLTLPPGNVIPPLDNSHVDEEEEAHFLRLVSILHDLLLCDATSPEKQKELQNHTVNLLVSIPSNCFEELMTPIQPDGADLPKDLEFDGRNMQAVAVLLRFLEKQLDCSTQGGRGQHETLSPILTVLVKGSRGHRAMRKYLRQRVLPPLTDVMYRPEEGNKIRNKLCRLLTTPNSQVSGLVADFLFVLCKESVSRMVKYTGYGNAAGLLANRGLLLGGSSNSRGSGSGPGRYSSDSEDSETEEYRNWRDQINPVTGSYEPPRSDPTINMSEEQKEYEASKLLDMMDKLSRGGIVQPCRIGEDGRPEPVEHVLELVENLPRQQIRPHHAMGSDEDSD
ncbi:Synembryn [Gryllus bimaculatus]|nr:Synembryn [Gryllus bimaculatus]